MREINRTNVSGLAKKEQGERAELVPRRVERHGYIAPKFIELNLDRTQSGGSVFGDAGGFS